jgi:diadenosine tetraphosphate (Ap4A) HIT family hydrolase
MIVCPFCRPSEDDVVLISRDGVIAVCDARPLLDGHVIIASRSHIPSILDLPEGERGEVRDLQENLASVIQLAYGEVGAYEHGRSAVCRFDMADGGHLHAHLHLIPFSFDLIAAAEGVSSSEPPTSLNSRADLRYLYQKLGLDGAESWCVAYGYNVPRHFVRSAAQSELTRRGVPWIALDSNPNIHDDAVTATAETIQGALASLGSSRSPRHG